MIACPTSDSESKTRCSQSVCVSMLIRRIPWVDLYYFRFGITSNCDSRLMKKSVRINRPFSKHQKRDLEFEGVLS